MFAQAPKFTVLDLPRLETNGEFKGMRLFLNLMRLDPSLWDDETVLKQFMAANNCGKGNAVIAGETRQRIGSIVPFESSAAGLLLRKPRSGISLFVHGKTQLERILPHAQPETLSSGQGQVPEPLGI